MGTKRLIFATLIGALLFGSGMAVGQRTSTFKFAKYLRPAVRNDIDLIVLAANVDHIRANIPMSNGMGVSQIYFNYEEGHPEAAVLISPDFEKQPLQNVRAQIAIEHAFAYSKLQTYMPDLKPDDFVLKVVRITNDSDRKLFAEFRNGNIVFH